MIRRGVRKKLADAERSVDARSGVTRLRCRQTGDCNINVAHGFKFLQSQAIADRIERLEAVHEMSENLLRIAIPQHPRKLPQLDRHQRDGVEFGWLDAPVFDISSASRVGSRFNNNLSERSFSISRESLRSRNSVSDRSRRALRLWAEYAKVMK